MSKRLGEKKYKEDWMIWIRVAHSTTRRRAREQHLAVARGGELGRRFVTPPSNAIKKYIKKIVNKFVLSSSLRRIAAAALRYE